MNPAVISADMWNMHVQQLHPPTATWKWPPPPLPPTPPPPPPPPPPVAASDHHDDRERFRRKFALAALKAGVPVPGHLSPEGGRCYEDIMMVPGVGMGHYDSAVLMGAGAGGYFSGAYFGQEVPAVQTVSGVQAVQVQAVRQRWRCPVEGCTKRFKSKQALKYHNETGHGKNDRECSGCGKVCKGDKNHRKHVAKCLPRN